jgi:hypothetical protein
MISPAKLCRAIALSAGIPKVEWAEWLSGAAMVWLHPNGMDYAWLMMMNGYG